MIVPDSRDNCKAFPFCTRWKTGHKNIKYWIKWDLSKAKFWVIKLNFLDWNVTSITKSQLQLRLKEYFETKIFFFLKP